LATQKQADMIVAEAAAPMKTLFVRNISYDTN
jgi:hypothetical protein